MRRFVCIAHEAPSDGSWALDDLPGSGRADVLCRNVQAALHLSHGIRPDVEVYLLFVEPRPRVVRLCAPELRRLYPDERSTAARLAKALGVSGSGPTWHEVDAGIAVAELDLADLLAEVPGTPVLLDPSGTRVEQTSWPQEATFFLSDHVPFTAQEYALLRDQGAQAVSLGDAWYHGNHAIAVVHHAMDRVFGAPQPK